MNKPTHRHRVTRIGHDRSGCTDEITVEEPLEIRLADAPIVVTMRTPGHDAELAAGLLFTEGVVENPNDITGATPVEADGPSTGNVIAVMVADHARIDPSPMRRCTSIGSSCGVCGKSAIEQVQRDADPVRDGLSIDPAVLSTMTDTMRRNQHVFDQTGGIHAAALFDATGGLQCLREDVGRHNAVDKVIGWAMLDGRLPLDESILVVSGRTSFEIVQKSLRASISIVASISATTSLAIEMANEGNMTLIGFLRDGRVTVYCGDQRVVGQSTRPDKTKMTDNG